MCYTVISLNDSVQLFHDRRNHPFVWRRSKNRFGSWFSGIVVFLNELSHHKKGKKTLETEKQDISITNSNGAIKLIFSIPCRRICVFKSDAEGVEKESEGRHQDDLNLAIMDFPVFS